MIIQDAIRKLERYCAYQERCYTEVEQKLSELDLIPEAREKVILHLREHKFLDEERYAIHFARGKFRIKKWGKLRIRRELKAKKISSRLMDQALAQIEDSDYLQTFHELAEKRFDSLVREQDRHKKQQKWFSYLQYRGWEAQLLYEKWNELTQE